MFFYIYLFIKIYYIHDNNNSNSKNSTGNNHNNHNSNNNNNYIYTYIYICIYITGRVRGSIEECFHVFASALAKSFSLSKLDSGACNVWELPLRVHVLNYHILGASNCLLY